MMAVGVGRRRLDADGQAAVVGPVSIASASTRGGNVQGLIPLHAGPVVERPACARVIGRPTLEPDDAGSRRDGPAERQLGCAVDLGHLQGAVRDDGTDDPPAVGAQGSEQVIESRHGQERRRGRPAGHPAGRCVRCAGGVDSLGHHHGPLTRGPNRSSSCCQLAPSRLDMDSRTNGRNAAASSRSPARRSRS